MVSLSKIRTAVNTDNARKLGTQVQRLGETTKRFNRSRLGEVASHVPYLGKGLSTVEKVAPKVGDAIMKGADVVDTIKGRR